MGYLLFVTRFLRSPLGYKPRAAIKQPLDKTNYNPKRPTGPNYSCVNNILRIVMLTNFKGKTRPLKPRTFTNAYTTVMPICHFCNNG